MRHLRFKVKQQTLVKADMFRNIIAGSKGYLRCDFEFSDDWNGMRKAASFYGDDGEEHAVMIENGSCAVPDEVTDLDVWKVRVTGMSGGSFVRTNTVNVRQEVPR